jgi:methyl-accepting chemotaxis protein
MSRIKKITEKVQEEGLANISDFLSDIDANQNNGELGFQFYLMGKVNEATDQVNASVDAATALTSQITTLTSQITTLTSQVTNLSKELGALSKELGALSETVNNPPRDGGR